MAKFYKGFECIKTKLLNFDGNDLAKKAFDFGCLGEFYKGAREYNQDDPVCQKMIDDIIKGKTFPKYVFEGYELNFRIENISRINLAQLTREKGFFCSASSGCRPLTNEFITPLSIYNNPEYMKKLKHIQSEIEELYCQMCEDDIPYLDSRYFGFHAQTISLAYHTNIINWCRSCNSRTENNFADEINYTYRLMLQSLKQGIKETVKDKLSLKLWNWLLSFVDKKTWYSRDNSYNNDFTRFEAPKEHYFEPAHNSWVKSGWKKELENMLINKPNLLFNGESEMITKWIELEKQGKELPTTYKHDGPESPATLIKEMEYYKNA